MDLLTRTNEETKGGLRLGNCWNGLGVAAACTLILFMTVAGLPGCSTSSGNSVDPAGAATAERTSEDDDNEARDPQPEPRVSIYRYRPERQPSIDV